MGTLAEETGTMSMKDLFLRNPLANCLTMVERSSSCSKENKVSILKMRASQLSTTHFAFRIGIERQTEIQVGICESETVARGAEKCQLSVVAFFALNVLL